MTASAVWQALDEQSADSGGAVVVSGANGWAGRTLIGELARHTGVVRRGALVALGRRAAVVDIDGVRVEIHPHAHLDEIDQPVTLFAPFAFLTRDREAEVGTQAYVYENLALISESVRAIQRLRPQRAIAVSSGLAAPDADGLSPSLATQPYGFLKNVEEWSLEAAATRAGANVAVGRLWAATGRLMPVARKYAISDFISQAAATGSIAVTSRPGVYRRYVDLGQFLEVLVGLSASPGFRVIDSGGERVEIGELARLVAERMGVGLSRAADGAAAPREDYCPDPRAFDAAAASLGVSLLALAAQVDVTVRGHLKIWGR